MLQTFDYKVVIEQDVPVAYRSVVVHEIKMGDVEDPDLFVATPMYEWMGTDEGKWLTEHSVTQLEWHRSLDHSAFCYLYRIVARLKESDLTFWQLKWNKYK